MNRAEVVEVQIRFNAAWPGRQPQKTTDELWVDQLKDIDAGFAEAAANALIGESKFYPSIAEFKARAQDFAKRARLEAIPALPALPPGERASSIDPKDALKIIREQLANANIGNGGGPNGPTIHPRYAPAHRKAEYANRFHQRKHEGSITDCVECREFLPEPKDGEQPSSQSGNKHAGPSHKGNRPEDCPICSAGFGLKPIETYKKIPECPVCKTSDFAEFMQTPLKDHRYWCIKCNTTFSGTFEERQAYSDTELKGTA